MDKLEKEINGGAIKDIGDFWDKKEEINQLNTEYLNTLQVILSMKKKGRKLL